MAHQCEPSDRTPRRDLTNRKLKRRERATRTNNSQASVLGAVGGDLDFYIDVHQNTGQRIEVATVGLSKEAARFIKETFRDFA